MSQVRVGVIGLAWGQLHVDALRRAKNVQLAAVCDTDAERAKGVAKNAGVPKFYTDYNELLAQEDIELVTVATPPTTQKEIAQRALFAKKAVLCETPAGLTGKEAEALYDTAQQRKIKNAVAFQTRYLPSYAYAKELIDEDYLGTFLRGTVSFVMEQPYGIHGNWAADDKRGGGVMRNIAVHFIDALQWWFGPVEAVMAERETLFSQVRRPVQVGREVKVEKFSATADDTFVSMLKLENGGTVILNFITGARHDLPWSINLVGSRATLEITSGTLYGRRETERDFGQLEIPRRLDLPERPREPLMWALCELATGLAAQVRGDKLEGRVPPTFKDAVRAHKVMEAIQRSSDDMLWANV